MHRPKFINPIVAVRVAYKRKAGTLIVKSSKYTFLRKTRLLCT